MMNKAEKAETILNNMLELYNMEMGCDYKFDKVGANDDERSCFRFASVNEVPFLYFTVFISNVTDYFSVEIFERTGFGVCDYNLLFAYSRYL